MTHNRCAGPWANRRSAGGLPICPLRASQSTYSHLRQTATGPFVFPLCRSSLAFRIDAVETDSRIGARSAVSRVVSSSCNEVREDLCAECVQCVVADRSRRRQVSSLASRSAQEAVIPCDAKDCSLPSKSVILFGRKCSPPREFRHGRLGY